MSSWLGKLRGSKQSQNKGSQMPDALLIASSRYEVLVPQILSDTICTDSTVTRRIFSRMGIAGQRALTGMESEDEDIRFAASSSGVSSPMGAQNTAVTPEMQLAIAFRALIIVIRWSCAYGFARGIHRAGSAEPTDELRMYSRTFSTFSLVLDPKWPEAQQSHNEDAIDYRAKQDEQEMLDVYSGFIANEHSQLLELLHVVVFGSLKGEDSQVPADWIAHAVDSNFEMTHLPDKLAGRLNALPTASSAALGILRSIRAARWETWLQEGIRFAWGHSDSTIDEMSSFAASHAKAFGLE